MNFPRERTRRMVSWPRPPRVSATMGRKWIPCNLHACRWVVSFLWTPIFRAWPGLKDAALTRHCCRGEIMSVFTPSTHCFCVSVAHVLAIYKYIMTRFRVQEMVESDDTVYRWWEGLLAMEIALRNLKCASAHFNYSRLHKARQCRAEP